MEGYDDSDKAAPTCAGRPRPAAPAFSRPDAARREPAESVLTSCKSTRSSWRCRTKSCARRRRNWRLALQVFRPVRPAPLGYFTLSQRGLILEANLAAATLLGVERESLVKQPITHFSPRGSGHYYCITNGWPKRAYASVRAARRPPGPGGAPLWVRLEAIAARLKRPERRLSHYDERHHAQKERIQRVAALGNASGLLVGWGRAGARAAAGRIAHPARPGVALSTAGNLTDALDRYAGCPARGRD